jgi:hypothetical protein
MFGNPMIKIRGIKSNWFHFHKDLIQDYIRETYSVSTNLEIVARKSYPYSFADKEFGLQKVWIFENTENGLKFLFDTHDHSNHGLQMLSILKHDPSVVHVIKSQFDTDKYLPTDSFSPASYYPREIGKYLDIVDEVRVHRKDSVKRDGLFFTGKRWKGRGRVVDSLREFIPQGFRLPFVDFVKHMSEYNVILSLPGHGNLCHREFEAFGIGVPVLMPKHKNTLYDPLIPDKHYISVDDTSQLKDKYLEVKDNKKLLKSISKNAMKWFDRNCRYPMCYKCFDKPIRKILEIK